MTSKQAQFIGLMRCALLALLCLCAPAPARAQDSRAEQAEPTPDQLEQTAADAADAFAGQRYDEAAEKLGQLIEWDPGNFVHYYNLACVRSVQGKSEAGAELVVQAVEHGFTDVGLLRRDPSLANARTTTAFTPRSARPLARW